LLAALLLAVPAIATPTTRGDHRGEVSPRLYCPAGYQILHQISVCPDATGGCEQIGEHANGGDCEFDGVGQDRTADHDGILAAPGGDGDYWSHPAYQVSAGLRDYSVTAQILLFDTGSGWTHQFNPPGPGVESVVAFEQMPFAFVAEPGTDWQLWVHHSSPLARADVYCDDGRDPVVWRSNTADSLPVVRVASPVECRVFLTAYCNQDASPLPQITECTASSGWFRVSAAPAPAPAVGCGAGPELLALLPLLLAARRSA